LTSYIERATICAWCAEQTVSAEAAASLLYLQQQWLLVADVAEIIEGRICVSRSTATFIICRRSNQGTCPVILALNMWSFVQNEVQQGLLNLQFAVVFYQAQLSKLVHEKIHTRAGRANHFGKCLMV
jgi:hypothetical protein